MLRKSLFPQLRHGIGGVGFPADKTFVHFNKAFLLQGHHMAGQVAVGYFQHLLEVVEAHFLIHHEDAHHPQANAVVEDFI